MAGGIFYGNEVIEKHYGKKDTAAGMVTYLKDAEDVENYLGLMVLGQIPYVESEDGLKRKHRRRQKISGRRGGF